ncbi:MAG TPA: alpha/beta fold hydrolase, partial [Saliniramus sp.]|nr:alpha/beta fold hydrolase [Saliniramus sp.]
MFEGFECRRIATREAEINLRIDGGGPPVLLLHGYPQTHVMWHAIAPDLARDRTVVCADLRGYGDSSKPGASPDHAAMSTRAMAADRVEAMSMLGFGRFMVAGHDRGGRVTHRMCLDHPSV